jgi:hypothetical protein
MFAKTVYLKNIFSIAITVWQAFTAFNSELGLRYNN